VPSVPISVLICVVVGSLFMALWQGWLRWAGMIPILAGVVIAFISPLPDLLLARDFALMAYRAEDGSLHVSSRKKDRFSIENWERMMGLPARAALVWPKEGGDGVMQCDHAACRLLLKGQRISFVRDREAVQQECLWAGILIAQDVIKEDKGGIECASKVVLDKRDGLRGGAHAIWLGDGDAQVQSASQAQGKRPWAE
jgi:competence protein ComEC